MDHPLAVIRDYVWSRLGDYFDALDLVIEKPLQEGFVVFGELDFSLVFGVER